MNLNELNKPTEAVGAAMLRGVTGDWTRIVLDAVAIGDLIHTGLLTTRPDGSEHRKGRLGIEGLKAVDELHSAMYQPGTGTWYSAQFTLNSAMEFEVDYNYGDKPLAEFTDDDIFLEDQELFPRDNEHLPAWHPAKK